MLDHACIWRKNGVMLWSHSWANAKVSAMNALCSELVSRVLLEERGGSMNEYQDDASTIKWVVDNELDIIIAAVHQKGLALSYLGELLDACRAAFRKVLAPIPVENRDSVFPCDAFTPRFDELHTEVEERAVNEKLKARKQRSFAESRKYGNTRQGQKESALGLENSLAAKGTKEPRKWGDDGATSGGSALSSPEPLARAPSDEAEGAGELSSTAIAANIAKMRAGGPRKKGGKKGGGKGEEDGEEEPRAKQKKEMRDWDGSHGHGNAAGGKKQLDFSKKEEDARARKFTSDKQLDLNAEYGGAPAAADAAASGSSFGDWARGLVGNKPLTRETLDPALEKLNSRLVAKNVAHDIGMQICESVCTNLLGKTVGSFGSLSATVRTAMADTLARILTPTRTIDVLAEVSAAKAQGRPCVIVFVGVNGVGKSTSLSKVAYYLRTNGFTPMLCACDTFRSGAVEQLRVHAQSLEIPLYEKGYGRDAAGIATDGIKHAQQQGYDAVLVDTAGRMQDNEPLMRALAKLVHVNTPDLVLFVGEALAGNDAVDQVTGFNGALADYAVSSRARLIDGLVLTKFDTINDKVGAALSLVFTTGKPIVFVGVGQTYEDIRNLNVEHVVKSLLS